MDTRTNPTNENLMARRATAIPRGIGNAHPVFSQRALNSEVWDVEGRRYIDFCAGIAVLNTGHMHPRVVHAVSAQAERFSHTCFQVVAYEAYVALAERLSELAPGNFAKKAFFMTTGAEAVENAVKVARAYTQRPGIITFNGAFHGRTMFALAMTAKVQPYRAGFEPLPGNVYSAPYPSEVQGVSVADAIKALEGLFRYQIDAKKVAAIFVEPVQGEGGYTPAPADFLKQLRKICDEHGILLVADEIQTGIARTGRMFAMEHSDVVPDLTTVAKGLGGGMPISGVVGRADVLDAAPPGGLGSTYAGHPMSCEAALTVLDVVEEEKLCDRAEAIGRRTRDAFTKMAKKFDFIGDVRGLGAMTGVEFFHSGDRRRPAPEIANKLKAEAFKRGLLLLTCGSYGNVLRVMTPLTVPFEVLEEGLGIIESVCEEIAR